MIVHFPLIWRPENIICNMASGSLIGQSNNGLSLPSILSSNFDKNSSFRAIHCAISQLATFKCIQYPDMERWLLWAWSFSDSISKYVLKTGKSHGHYWGESVHNNRYNTYSYIHIHIHIHIVQTDAPTAISTLWIILLLVLPIIMCHCAKCINCMTCNSSKPSATVS